MDTTLIINPGSSSKKYALFKNGSAVLTVHFEKIGDGFAVCTEINGTRTTCGDVASHTYIESLQEVITIAIRENFITTINEIGRIGIRVVAPGTFFTAHRIIDDAYIRQLKKIIDAAPLHIPHVITEIEYLQKTLPQTAVLGVSDSAFHSTIPEHARLYSLKKNDIKELDLYRFGYHGLSVSSVIGQMKEELGVIPSRTIVCHIGSGVSVTALKEGRSVDTTMGFSPLGGVMMNSRSAEIDPGALIYLMKKKNLTIKEVEEYLNQNGGLKGMLGQGDLRIALDRMSRGDHDARVAVTAYMYHIKKAIGTYIAVLGGVDLLILTATAAERNPLVRASICAGLESIGIILDSNKNESVLHHAGFIQTEKSTTTIAVVHTNEMREIARITNDFIF